MPRVGADKLKPMIKIWGGSYKMSKYACIDFIVTALKDPARVQAAVASLQPWDRNFSHKRSWQTSLLRKAGEFAF